jgi:hypothetical protein
MILLISASSVARIMGMRYQCSAVSANFHLKHSDFFNCPTVPLIASLSKLILYPDPWLTSDYDVSKVSFHLAQSWGFCSTGGLNSGLCACKQVLYSLSHASSTIFHFSKNLTTVLGTVAHAVIPVLRRLKQLDHKFKASLAYIVSPYI